MLRAVYYYIAKSCRFTVFMYCVTIIIISKLSIYTCDIILFYLCQTSSELERHINVTSNIDVYGFVYLLHVAFPFSSLSTFYIIY